MPTAEQMQQAIKPLFPGLMGVEIKEATPEQDRRHHAGAPRPVHRRRRLPRRRLHGVCRHHRRRRHGDEPPAGHPHHDHRIQDQLPRRRAVNTRITAESTPLHRGKTTQVWQTMIRSEAGKLCAVVTQTQMVLPAA